MNKNEIVKKIVKINTNKVFVFHLPFFIRYLLNWDVLILLLLFSLVFIIFPFSTLAYGFFIIITLMMVYKLAFDVFADFARGNMSPNVRMNYLVTNGIAVKVLLIALIIELVDYLMKQKGYSSNQRFYFMAVSTFITPALYMSLALTNSVLVALNPIVIVRVIKVTNLSYFLFVGFWLLSIQLHEQIINPLLFEYMPTFIDGVLSSFVEYFLLVLNFQIMGYIVFQKRNEFDLESMGFDKVADDNVVVETFKVNPIYERIKMLLAEDDAVQALSIVVALQKDGDRSAELMGLFKRAMDQKMYSPTNLEIAKKIHSQLQNGQVSKAFKSVAEHLDSGKDFIEVSPKDIHQLISYAAQNNKIKHIAHLAHDFHVKYPYHVDIVPNYFILAKLLYNQKNTREQSKQILIGLVTNYSSDKMMPEVKSWLKGLELMSKK